MRLLSREIFRRPTKNSHARKALRFLSMAIIALVGGIVATKVFADDNSPGDGAGGLRSAGPSVEIISEEQYPDTGYSVWESGIDLGNNARLENVKIVFRSTVNDSTDIIINACDAETMGYVVHKTGDNEFYLDFAALDEGVNICVEVWYETDANQNILVENETELYVGDVLVDSDQMSTLANPSAAFSMESTGELVDRQDGVTQSARKATYWKVYINKNKTVLSPDYAPWFSTTLSSDLELANWDNTDTTLQPQFRVTATPKVGQSQSVVTNVAVDSSTNETQPIDLSALFPSLSDELNEVSYEVEYYAFLDDAKAADPTSWHRLDNDVALSINNSRHPITRDTSSIENNLIEKHDLSNELLNGNTIHYSVIVNPLGLELNGGNIVTFTDVLDGKTDLVLDSVTVYDENDDDVTSLHSIIYNPIENAFSIWMDDETALRVEYDVVVKNAYEGYSDEFTNYADLSAGSNVLGDDTVTQEHEVGEISSESTGTVGVKVVHFYDADSAVAGASIILDEYALDGSDVASLDTTHTYHTNGDGQVIFPSVTTGTLYSWRGGTAPGGHIFTDPDTHYFMFYERGQNSTETLANYVDATTRAREIEEANGWASGTIEVEQEDYIWQTAVHEGEAETFALTVAAKVQGNIADPEKVFSYSLELDEENIPQGMDIAYVKDGEYTVLTLTGNPIEFTLKHGEEISFILPENLRYEVSQTTETGYILTTPADSSGLIDENTRLEFVNSRSYTPQTGVDENLKIPLTLCIIAGCSIATLIAYFASKYKRRV